MNRRIFIFGAEGMLGWMTNHYLSQKGFETVPLPRSKFNILNSSVEALHDEYTFTEQDVIINAAGVTNRQIGILPDNSFQKINSEFPMALDALAKATGCRFIHVTTDCIFSGDQGGYWESSAPSPRDIYANSKLQGESLKNAVVLRTSIVGIERKHFYSLISWVLSKNGGSAQGYTNHTWNGITTLQFTKIFESFIQGSFPEPGLYHLFSKHIVTKYDLIRIIARIFDTQIQFTPYQTKHPVLRHLTSTKNLCESLCIPDIEVQLEEMKAYCIKFDIQWKSI